MTLNCYPNVMDAFQTICLTILGVTITMIGDIYLKRSNGLQHPSALLVGLLFYAIGSAPVAFIFRKMQFAGVFVLWEALTIVLAFIVSRAVFGEPLTRHNLIALGLAIVAMFFSVK